MALRIAWITPALTHRLYACQVNTKAASFAAAVAAVLLFRRRTAPARTLFLALFVVTNVMAFIGKPTAAAACTSILFISVCLFCLATKAARTALASLAMGFATDCSTE
mmetsp:Transcript_32771/g.54159  ORF Transcript_32771/g.54159 Transcript_32771/m.54159 type:complete len:108 (-) Transcript_32771:155-478(-)